MSTEKMEKMACDWNATWPYSALVADVTCTDGHNFFEKIVGRRSPVGPAFTYALLSRR